MAKLKISSRAVKNKRFEDVIAPKQGQGRDLEVMLVKRKQFGPS